MPAPTDGQKISALTDGVNAQTNDQIPASRGVTDVRISPGYLLAYIQSALSILASQVSDFNTAVRTNTLNQMTAPTADLSINTHKLTNVTDPTSAQDAATKNYVDAVAQGLSAKGSSRLATVAALPANTYLAGVLTGVATGVLTVDGSTVALNDRILVKDEVTQANNGLYLCTTAGAIGVAYVLTRTTDMDIGSEVPGAYSFVEAGTVNVGAGFTIAGAGPYTIGVTAIVWTQFSGAGEITVSAPITKTGNQIGITSPLPLANGGTNAATAATARASLGIDAWTAVADTNYTALATDKAIGYTSITAARTVTLPAANALNAGQELLIGDVSGSVTGTLTITINRAGSDTINGATSYVISTPRAVVRLVSDGSSKWYFDVVGPGRGGALAFGRPLGNAVTYLSKPGFEIGGSNVSSGSNLSGRIHYEPMIVTTTITIDQILCEITTAGAAATTLRMGLYNANANWQPTSLIVDGGTVAGDSNGQKTISTTQVLPPGRYLLARQSSADISGIRALRAGTIGLSSTLTASLMIQNVYKTATAAAFTDPGTAWDSVDLAATPFNHCMFVRISVP